MGIVKKFLVILFLFFIALSALPQKEVRFFANNDSSFTTKKFSDSISLIKYLEEKLHDDFSNGFLYANYKFINTWGKDTPSVLYNKENKVFLKSISTGNADKLLLEEIGYKKNDLNSSALSPTKIYKWQKNIVEFYENNGHPFASVAFNIDSLYKDTVSASWEIKKGPKIFFDSIIYKGKYKPNKKFISRWLGIESGKIYDERKIELCKRRLASSTIIEQEIPMQVHFTEGKAKIFLFLKKKKSNQFDGILGFATDKNNPEKIVFNGDINLNLSNSFNHGDVIALRWKNSAEKSQEVNAKFSIPYIFGFPLGFNIMLDIYKRDTLYIKTNQHYGLTFFSGISTEFEFFAERNDCRIIDKNIFISSGTMPKFIDSRSSKGGIRVLVPKIDDFIVPHKGFIFETKMSVGKKKIIKNSSADVSIYEGMSLNSTIYEGIAEISYFQQIIKALHLMGRTNFFTIESTDLFENDMALIGGLQKLRGFDEKSIYAKNFSVSTLELRFFFEKHSYLSLFSDYGIVKQRINNNFSNKYYLSTGAGLSFETRAGIFNIFYALGKENPGKFNIKNGKVHFGLITRF